MTRQDALAKYDFHGLKLIPIPAGAKAAAEKWHLKTYTGKDIEPDSNVAIVFDDKDIQLSDLDFDHPHAARLAELPELFGSYPAFGRPSDAYPGHRLVAVLGSALPKDEPGVLKLAFTVKKDQEFLEAIGFRKHTIIEWRRRGCYTVAPPSILPHREDPTKLEQLEWVGGSVPSVFPNMHAMEIEARVRLIGFLVLVGNVWPKQGVRDETAMAVGGALARFCRRFSLDPKVADAALMEAARIGGDDEAHHRGKVQQAFNKLLADENAEVTGLPRCLEMLGLQSLEKPIRRWLGETDVVPTAQQMAIPANAIWVDTGNIVQFIDEVDDALLASGQLLFVRGGEVVKIVNVETEFEITDGVKRAKGSAVIQPVTPYAMMSNMREAAPFFKIVDKKPKAVDVPLDMIRAYLASTDRIKLPLLNGLITAPTLDRDGRDIQHEGYDEATRVYAKFREDDFPPVPYLPTKEDAEEALARLIRPMRGFTFAPHSGDDEEAVRQRANNRAVALSAVLTAAVRRLLPAAPMHVFDAPDKGTGKTKLASYAGLVVTGLPTPTMEFTANEEENRKKIAASLRSGDPILFFDDVQKSIPVGGSFVNQLLTSAVIRDRLLGQSVNMELLTNALILATGNNISVLGDTVRRTVKCRLDAGGPRPYERQFDFSFEKEVLSQRHQLLIDCLTIMRAWLVMSDAERAKALPADHRVLGSFDDWDRMVRQPLIWLGAGDPYGNAEELEGVDPELEQQVAVLRAWHQLYGSSEVLLVTIEEEIDDGADITRWDAVKRLAKRLTEWTGRPTWNTKSVGRKLLGIKDRFVGGYVLRARDTNMGRRWRVDLDPSSKGETQS